MAHYTRRSSGARGFTVLSEQRNTLTMHKPQRSLFEIPEGVCYLNCAYMAPRLRSVSEAGRQAISNSARPWTISSDDFFALPNQLRDRFARLVGASETDIALIPSVSYGIGIAAANLAIGKGRDVLVLDEQFPSNLYPWQSLAVQQGARLVTVARPADCDWTSAVLERLGDDIAVAALPEAHWTDGSRLDLKRIGAHCREIGCNLVLDLTQSLGAVPFSVADVQPDFMVAAAYKWLLGPYSVTYLYVAPKHQQGRPLEQPWMARAGSENFAGLVDYQEQYRAGARRYDAGEHSSFVLLPMALAALEQILEWGPANIASTLGTLTDTIARHAESLGYQLPTSANRSPHLLGLRFPQAVPGALLQALHKHNIHVSVRGNCIRVAPHLHIDETDLERFLSLLVTFAPSAEPG